MSAEAEVLRRFEAGQSLQQIRTETGLHRRVVERAANYASEATSERLEEDLRTGSQSLVAAIAAEVRDFEQRRRIARASGTVRVPVPMRTQQLERVLVAPLDDPRPLASSREPCFRCNVRGDLGCAHQRPFQP